MRKITIILAALFLPYLYAFAQLANWKNYTSMDMVMCMSNDGEHLWIGTNGGLVRLNKQTGGMQYYNRQDGLPQIRVSAMATDSKGTLWVSSENCVLAKFNGTSFDIQTATDSISPKATSQNYALTIDEKDRVWYGALAMYEKDEESGSSYIRGWSYSKADRFSQKTVQAILPTVIDGKEVLLIGGYIGIYPLLKFDGNELTSILKDEIPSAITQMAHGKNGSIWIATQKSGLINYAADGTVTTYNTANSSIPNNNVYDVKTDREGNCWLACGRSLVKFDGKDFVTYQSDLIEPMNDMNFILTVMPDEDGIVWIGTKRQGLLKFANEKFTLVDISPVSAFTDSYMGFSMCTDSNGNIWSGNRQGLIKIDSQEEWHNLFKLDYNNGVPTSNRIQSVGCDLQGNVWAALSMSDTCVVKMSPDGKVIEAFPQSIHPILKAGTQRESCFAFDSQGNVWWGTFAALYQYDGKEWKPYTSENSPMPCSAVTDLKIDRNGVLWGTLGFQGQDGGLFKLEGNEWTVYTTQNSGLPTPFPICLDIDSNNRIWLHCRDKSGNVGKMYGSGLTCFDGKTWTSYTTENSGIPSNTIWDITINSCDHIWMGTTEAGLTGLDLTEETWTNYNMDNSDIASNEVSCILVDKHRNQLWMNHLDGNGISSVEFGNAQNLRPELISRDSRIQAIGSALLCTSPTAVKLEVYTMDAIKVDEANFANGEATVKVDKAPVTYLYIVTYPNGRRESGKVAVK